MYIHRNIESQLQKSLQKKNTKILIILGPRQAGKTTLIKHALQGKKVKYLNLDLRKDQADFETFSRLSPQSARGFLGNPDFLVIDEAQRNKDTARIVKGFWDSNIRVKFILLGSSSLDIKNQAAESLAGRNEKIYLTPFSFKEALSAKDWYHRGLPLDIIYKEYGEQLKTELIANLVYGSYPEAVLAPDKEAFLGNLVEDFVFKDILDLDLVKSKEPLYKLLGLLAGQIGGEVSINELAAQLGQARATVEKYLNLLEETFVIFRLTSFSRNARKEINKSKKIYFWDTGIRNAVLGEFSLNELRSDIGQLWENWVVAEAAKQNLQENKNAKFYFWRSRVGSEVDLLVKLGNKLHAYEAKWQKRNIATRAFEDSYKIKVKLLHSGEPIISFFETPKIEKEAKGLAKAIGQEDGKQALQEARKKVA